MIEGVGGMSRRLSWFMALTVGSCVVGWATAIQAALA